MKQLTALIDADIILYQAAFGNQLDITWDSETRSQAVDPEMARNEFEAIVASITTAANCKDAVLCFSCADQENFRYQVLPSYKHNRNHEERPALFYELKAWALEHFECRMKPKLEADDVLGILATRTSERFVVCSLDKDLDQITGAHYNWRKERIYQVTPEQADKKFYMQVLIGDPTDGFSGCPGIGPKKAEKILGACGPLPGVIWKAIVETYEKKGLTEAEALQQARVARILRCTDYDFEKKEPILWSPS